MAVLYSIRDWDKHFEVAQSRKAERISWVATPVKHDGLSFRRLMAMPKGLEIYAAWCLILQVAAKCPTRGILANEDGPLTSLDLALKTGAPENVFQNSLEVLCSERIGWLSRSTVAADYQPAPRQLPLHNSTEQDSTLQNTSPNGEGCSEVAIPRPSKPSDLSIPAGGGSMIPKECKYPVFPTVPGRSGKDTYWRLTAEQVSEWVGTFPAVKVSEECRKAHAWIMANMTRRKTAKGMGMFLYRWLSKAQDRGGDRGDRSVGAKPAYAPSRGQKYIG